MDINSKKECKIKYLPVSFFSMILGMSGFTLAFQKAEVILDLPFIFSHYFLTFTLLCFFILFFAYLIKILKFIEEVKEEFTHPIKLSFFPTFSMSLLLISTLFIPINILLSKYIWVFGSIIQFMFTIRIISIWIQDSKFEIKHMNPSWFIPAAGNLLIPFAGTHHFSLEISWFFYSIGLIFWLVLLSIFFNRIIFHSPLPEKLLPTLFILLAPPSLGFISFLKLTGEITEFSKILYYFALFLFFLLVAQIKMFKNIKFYLSWWAYSFPIAAITTASMLMFKELDILIFKYISLSLFFVLNVIIVTLLIKTFMAIKNNQICIKD
jgi:tellurite resistance protein